MIGSRLKKARVAKSLTQTALAGKINVSLVTLWYWENNQRIPNGKALLLLMVILDLKKEDFLPGLFGGNNAN